MLSKLRKKNVFLFERNALHHFFSLCDGYYFPILNNRSTNKSILYLSPFRLENLPLFKMSFLARAIWIFLWPMLNKNKGMTFIFQECGWLVYNYKKTLYTLNFEMFSKKHLYRNLNIVSCIYFSYLINFQSKLNPLI